MLRIGLPLFPQGIRDGLYHGKPMFQADQIAQTLKSPARQPEVFEFPGAVDTGGIENDMIVDMGAIRVGGDDEGAAWLPQRFFGRLHAE